MSFGLGRGRPLNVAPGLVGIDASEIPSLPDDILSHPQSGWIDLRALFQAPGQPLELEIGCGKGAFLLQHGEARPDINLLGIEWAGEFYAYAADRVRRRGLGNVRLLHTDAVEFLHWRVPDGELDTIHLYFSDPWPKARHHKNRVVQDRFLADVWRKLKPGGELRIVTDHDDYWAWMEERFARWTAPARAPELADWITTPAFARRPFEPLPNAAPGELVGTNFERKYQREGRPFHGVILVRLG
jgi:tRNA (guanine-N7-)-methyltransferase